MPNRESKLWPYSIKTALFLIPVVWILFAIVFSLTHYYFRWPDSGSQRLVTIVALIVSSIPIALLLLDFLSSNKAALKMGKLFEVDFGRIVSQPIVKYDGPILPANMGVSGLNIPDSGPMNIVEALKEAIENEIAVLDIKDGDAWWVTRLLALSAGAVRNGSPQLFVIVGKKENVQGKFLGFSKPIDIQRSILKSKKEYETEYLVAVRMARQIIFYGNNELLPEIDAEIVVKPNNASVTPPGPDPKPIALTDLELKATFSPNYQISRYIANKEYTELGEAVFEQVLMRQLASKSLENPPDRLTLGRLIDLLGHCLYRDSIDLSWSKEEQISKLLDSNVPYIALVRNGQYENMIKREEVERLIIRELFLKSQE